MLWINIWSPSAIFGRIQMKKTPLKIKIFSTFLSQCRSLLFLNICYYCYLVCFERLRDETKTKSSELFIYYLAPACVLWPYAWFNDFLPERKARPKSFIIISSWRHSIQKIFGFQYKTNRQICFEECSVVSLSRHHLCPIFQKK